LNGPGEVKNHIWLKGIDWQALSEKKAPAPFKPCKKLAFFTIFRGETCLTEGALGEG
jgi:hypothetical protein